MPPACLFVHRFRLLKSSPKSFTNARVSSFEFIHWLTRLAGKQSDMQPCKFFFQSRCTKGSSCPFRHDTTTTASASGQTSSIANGQKSIPCRFFASGECRNGDSCAFRHDVIQPPAVNQKAASLKTGSEPTQDSRTQVICKFYLRGECSQGHVCPYKHLMDGSGGQTRMEDSDVSRLKLY